jgi:Rrf2 family iron-sulfur cluster assembly transcriptional regulator
MRLTTKGRFAVTAMLDLALRQGNGPVTLAGISERQRISLRRRKLVDSVRGPGGGYCLARAAQEISIAEIIRAVDEPIDATQCGGKENCHEKERCMTHDLWVNLNATIYDYLTSVTLGNLVDSQLAKQHGAEVAVLIDKRGPKAAAAAV